jgi:hypothetical protein
MINNQLPFSLSSDRTKRQEAEFMYGLFLRDILINIESSEKEFIEFCRQKYVNSQADLNAIDEFEEYYDACNAIFWYTRDIFLYRLLNKALREQDIDTLYSLRYFIKDLHLQLKERHASQQHTPTTTGTGEVTTSDDSDSVIETVYRGQLMSNEEFDKRIQNNKGGFFSVSGFLSTTMHQTLARVYAGDSSNKVALNEQSVLFQIDIKKSVNKFPYANISKESVFEDDESEILFTMGSVFRIHSITLNDQGVWMVKLLLTGEEDQELRTLTEYMQKNSFFSSNSLVPCKHETQNCRVRTRFYRKPRLDAIKNHF